MILSSQVNIIPTHALFIKTLKVLKNRPYICFGQLTGHLQGQLAFKAQSAETVNWPKHM
jgi:hypothetical protein